MPEKRYAIPAYELFVYFLLLPASILRRDKLKTVGRGFSPPKHTMRLAG